MNLRHLLAFPLLLAPVALAGQVATVEEEAPVRSEREPGDVLGDAHDAQARFERTRLRLTPLALGRGTGACDEYVGRFCTSYSEGEWYPREEDEDIGAARQDLLAELDSIGSLLPTDPWIAGQRVWYRIDGGNGEGALVAARECRAVAPGWCLALEGLALHVLGRYGEALAAFDGALQRMPEEVAGRWRLPERAVDGDARDILADAEEIGPAALSHTLSLIWALADPLWLVDGNDRLTAHYARWTVSEIKRDARNPYGLSWGNDLEELTVRHGWEIGWERHRLGVLDARDLATGHKHPEGRDYMPSGDVLRDPASADAEAMIAGRPGPRSLYAPAYAPVVLPMAGQLAVFPRGNRFALVATAFLPDDTSHHAQHDHPKPWMEPGDQEGMPDRYGVFALPVDEDARATPLGTRRVGSAGGALMLDLPAGAYVVSAESWSPEARRAGRLRMGVRREPAPADVATVSDLLLLAPSPSAPGSLEDALLYALPAARIEPEDPLAVAWEISGLGFRDESLAYEVSVERTDRGFLRRVGELFGLAERARPLTLSWEEPGPDRPAVQFRYLALDLPALDRGDYRITLRLRTAGRSDVVATRAFEVAEPQRPPSR